ncbi:hypothetical protein OUZ56_032976 [Daphnia magna]|uniref:Uncharacterized protein n=1 Tax=Daphnia magna TaxID=35525 RepID=A0ABR0B9X0_9CRUS|nr:hypothetical protein OUZ56_023512 [Daphnia magna]KAK4045373.1 hypothetical protein OUZ56_032976 [Daphnia magna]
MDIKPSEIYYYYPTPYTPHPKIVIVLQIGSLAYIGYWCKIRVLIAWISFFSFNIWSCIETIADAMNKRSHSVAVITSALHAEGPQFDPG